LDAAPLLEISSPRTIEPFDFSKVQSITYSYGSPKEWAIDLDLLLQHLVNKKVNIINTGVTSLDVHSMLSPVTVVIDVRQAKDALLFLSISASVNGVSESGFKGEISLFNNIDLIPVEKTSKEELANIIKNRLKPFIETYLASHTTNNSDTFYIIPQLYTPK